MADKLKQPGWFWRGRWQRRRDLAECQGRERVGVLKIEEHSVWDSARRTEGGVRLEATASVADPYENSVWWFLYHMLVLRVL